MRERKRKARGKEGKGGKEKTKFVDFLETRPLRDRWKINTRSGAEEDSRAFSSGEPPRNSSESSSVPRAPCSRPRAFSLMYSQIFVLTRCYHSPNSPDRLYGGNGVLSRARQLCVCVYVCMCVTPLASARVCEQRRVLLFSALHRGGGGIHFAAQRPRLPRTAPFDCFDYPYLIPRSSSPGRFPTDSRLEASSFLPSFLSFDLDSPFSFRHAEKHRLDTSRRRRVARDAKSLAKIHRRKYAWKIPDRSLYVKGKEIEWTTWHIKEKKTNKKM